MDDATSDTSPASLTYPTSNSARCLIENTELKIQGNGAFCGYIETNGNSIIDNLTANVSITSTNSCDGTLSMDKITDIGLEGIGPLINFLRDGTWEEGKTKDTIGKSADGVTTINTTSTIRADVNSENNITTLYANSTYIADKGFNYFKREATDITLNISLHVSSWGGLFERDSITINVNVYSDSNKSNLIATKELTAENGFMSGGNTNDVSVSFL